MSDSEFEAIAREVERRFPKTMAALAMSEELDALRARVARLEGALMDFASMYERSGCMYGPFHPVSKHAGILNEIIFRSALQEKAP